MMRVCIVVTIVAGDTNNELRDLFGVGATTGLKDYVVGRDLDQSGEFGRWVLAHNGVPVTTTNPKGEQVEVEVKMLIAYNSNISATKKTHIGTFCNNRPTLARQLEFNPPKTRLEMVDRLKVEVGQEMACSHYWHSKAGDSVAVADAAELLAKFIPVPE